ncbi:hypothetical protein PBI_ALSFRO_79 [Mycobacterium phage Alsfro]|nr:exonuclease [Mycobacterium phage Alsfro]AHK12130.1 hypothetical protein PBI_ALSFRO_79 [Mycobacterium phage Alsfro]
MSTFRRASGPRAPTLKRFNRGCGEGGCSMPTDLTRNEEEIGEG